MAELVFGAGTSHSPMLLLDADGWREWALPRDASMTDLADGDGVVRSYHQWVERNAEQVQPELADEVLREKVKRCAEGLAELRRRIAAADLDALIIVGDDQGEHLGPTNLPPILIFHGPELVNGLSPLGDDASPLLRTITEGYFEPAGERTYPVDVALAKRLIDQLLDNGFDVATSSSLPAARPEGHAFQYVHRHLTPAGLPTVPILLNTYMAPAQPRARRCIELGKAIGAAVTAMDDGRRVGIIGSGGLSHFLVSEDLDRRVLDACAKHDTESLASIPEAALQSGTSEIKIWMTVAGACGGLEFDLIDYVAGYRTPAGTGTGLAFATWGAA